jgi:hypothetical protein
VRTNSKIIIAGLAVGLAIGGTFMALADDDPLPPEKQDAIANATPLPDVPNPPDKATLQSPHADGGNPSDVAQVKSNVARVMDAYWNAMALPTDIVARQAQIADGRAERRDVFAQVWTREALPTRVGEMEKALELVATDPTYQAYSKARFVVEEWQGVTVEGTQANVVVTGHPEFLVPSTGWQLGARSQFQLALTKQQPGSNGWRLANWQEITLGGVG